MNNLNVVRVARAAFSKRETGIIVAFLALCLVFALIAPGFANLTNLLNIGRQVAILGILACGLGTVMISGNIDLSIGAIYGLTSVLVAMMLSAGLDTGFAILLGLLVGMAAGALNGFFVVKTGVNSFIATFGMSYILRGIALIITSGYPITLALKGVTNETHPVFHFIGQGYFLGLPMQFIFLLIVVLITYFILHRTILGTHIFAIGGSERAAYVSGVKVGRVRMFTFIFSGVLASLSGILSLSFIGSVIPTAGTGMEFDVFAAVIIGGTSMSGGIGSVVGMMVGVLIFGVIRNGLVLLGVTAFWQTLIIGIITIGAVVYDSMVQRSRARMGG